jgi:AcrR family transcriptional regulator
MAKMDRGLPKGTRKRVQILKSAAAAFRVNGYHGTTVEDIAKALRMTKGSLYYYFKNKEEILYVCHDYSLDLLLDDLKKIQASRTPTDDKLRALIRAFVILLTDEFHGVAGLSLELQALSPKLREKIVVKRDRFEAGVRTLIDKGIQERIYSPVDSKVRCLAIMGAVNWIPRWFHTTGRLRPQELASEYADYFVRGLLAPTGAPEIAPRQTPRRSVSTKDRS